MLVKKLAVLALISGVALGGTMAFAQDKPKAPEKQAEKAAEKKAEKADPKSAGKPEDAKAGGPSAGAEEAWAKAGAVGENHKLIATLSGKWKSANKFWMVPDTEPMSTESAIDGSMIMGGRFLQRTMKGDMMGMPFEGLETFGFDNIRNKFVSTWIDNMGTAIYFSEGTQDPATKVITMMGTMDDPETGKPKKTRSTLKIDSPDQHTFVMFETPTGGKEAKVMEIVYTRVK